MKEWVDADDFVLAAAALSRQGFERQAGRTVMWAFRRAANAVRRRVRAAVRPHRKSGRLASNVRVYFFRTGLDFEAMVKSTGPVAHLIAGGVAPHSIERKSAQAMTIRGPGIGQSRETVGFATAVQHPGFRPDPYFARGVRDSEPDVDAIFDTAAGQMVSELSFRMGRGR